MVITLKHTDGSCDNSSLEGSRGKGTLSNPAEQWQPLRSLPNKGLVVVSLPPQHIAVVAMRLPHWSFRATWQLAEGDDEQDKHMAVNYGI